jgi:hypothetical protein
LARFHGKFRKTDRLIGNLCARCSVVSDLSDVFGVAHEVTSLNLKARMSAVRDAQNVSAREKGVILKS